MKTGTLKADAAKSDVTNADAPKVVAPNADASKAAEAVVPKAAEKPAEPANEPTKAAADAPTVAPDAKKDPSRLPGAEKAATKAEPPKRTGQIAVFVSRKDAKLYVRQNFAPLFDVPVTIAPSDRLLGTHVFTAEADKNDPNKLRWSVVSLPVTARNATRNEDDDRAARRRKVAGGAPAEVKPAPAAEQPGRSAGPHHHPAGCDGAHHRGADDRRLDHRVRPGHQPGRNRRRHRFHRFAALELGLAITAC